MRFVPTALVLCVMSGAALAQTGRVPAIVVPGRPDVPVIINGVDASWSVVEGDFGLARPGLFTPTVIYRLPPVVGPLYGPAANGTGYFPHTGEKPGYGRLEVIPPPDRPLPPPAPSYRKSWSSSSDPTPADLPSTYNPAFIAPMIAPTINGGHRHHHRPALGGSSPGQGQGQSQRQSQSQSPAAWANPAAGGQPLIAPAAMPASAQPAMMAPRPTVSPPASMSPAASMSPPATMSPPAGMPLASPAAPTPGSAHR